MVRKAVVGALLLGLSGVAQAQVSGPGGPGAGGPPGPAGGPMVPSMGRPSPRPPREAPAQAPAQPLQPMERPEEAKDPSRYTDVAVLNRLYLMNRLEAEVGVQGRDRGSSTGVRGLGERLLRDHAASATAVEELAKKKGVSLGGIDNPGLPAADRESIKLRAGRLGALASLRGAAFDKRFLTLEIEGHDDLRTYLQEAQDACRDPEVRAFVSTLLPQAETHAQLARDVAAAPDHHGMRLGRSPPTAPKHK